MIRPNRKTFYQVKEILQGGALTANQQRYVDRQNTPEAKKAMTQQFEEYNSKIQKEEEQARQGYVNPVAQELTKEYKERDVKQKELAKEIADAGGIEAWIYGDNKPIIFDQENQAIRSSKGVPAISIRKTRFNNWEIDYKDKSREFLPTGDERFFLNAYSISADNIPQLIERIGLQVDEIKAAEERRKASLSGFERFMEGLNDTLIDIADVGTLIAPGAASNVYETFRPMKTSEQAEANVSQFVESALMSKTQAEKTYDDLRPGGRLHGILEYDPELAEKIEQFDEYGPMLKRALSESEGGAKSKYALHAVIIDNKLSYPNALKIAQRITKKKKIFMRPTSESYRFRNIPKTQFVQSSFRSKVVNPQITLVFGKLK